MKRKLARYMLFWGAVLVILGGFSPCATADEAYLCAETEEGGVCLKKGTVTVWEFHPDSPEGKPFIAPMRLPDGRDAALLRPADHVWHLGIWFSWKYLNGVNYWEPSDGETVVKSHQVTIDGASATVRLQMVYRNKKEPETEVLREDRVIVFGTPDATGSYTIDFQHKFTACEKDVELERTPPHVHGGGYAGLAVRLAPFFGKFETNCANGETEMRTIREKTADWIEYRDPETGNGVRVTVLKGTENTRFYAQKSPGYCFINPCPVLSGPQTIPAGETLELEYRIQVGK